MEGYIKMERGSGDVGEAEEQKGTGSELEILTDITCLRETWQMRRWWIRRRMGRDRGGVRGNGSNIRTKDKARR